MTTRPSIDLSGLTVPSITSDLTMEKLGELAEDYRKLVLHGTSMETLLVKVILKLFIKREELVRLKMDQAATAVMLATSQGNALDQLSASYGVKRMVVIPADLDASPPTDAVMESDDRLRMRTRLSLQALSQAGCMGTYLFHAMSSSPHLKDISVYSDDQNLKKINIVILSEFGRGDQDGNDSELISQIEQALMPISSVTDQINVQWANVFDYKIDAEIGLYPDVDRNKVHTRIIESVQELVRKNHRLGKNILRDELFSALYQDGVETVHLFKPANDLSMSLDSVAFNSADPSDKTNFRIEISRQPDLQLESQDPIMIRVRTNRLLRMASEMK